MARLKLGIAGVFMSSLFTAGNVQHDWDFRTIGLAGS